MSSHTRLLSGFCRNSLVNRTRNYFGGTGNFFDATGNFQGRSREVHLSGGAARNSCVSGVDGVLRRHSFQSCAHGYANKGDVLSRGFVCCADVQLIRHTHQFSERFGLHLEHHPAPLNFDGPFTSAELGARLFVE